MQIVCAFRSAQRSQSTLFRVLSNFVFSLSPFLFLRSIQERNRQKQQRIPICIFATNCMRAERNKYFEMERDSRQLLLLLLFIAYFFLFLLFILQSNEMKKIGERKVSAECIFSLCLVTANKAQAIQVREQLHHTEYLHRRTLVHASTGAQCGPFIHAHIFHTPTDCKLLYFTVYEHFARFHHRLRIYAHFQWFP